MASMFDMSIGDDTKDVKIYLKNGKVLECKVRTKYHKVAKRIFAGMFTETVTREEYDQMTGKRIKTEEQNEEMISFGPFVIPRSSIEMVEFV